MLQSPIGDCTVDYAVALSLSLTTICSSNTAVAAAVYVNTTVSDTAATAYLLAVTKTSATGNFTTVAISYYHFHSSLHARHETAAYTESATANTTNCCCF